MASPYSQEILYANTAQTTLGSALSSSATTIVLATGQGMLFPSPSLGQAFLGTLSPAGTTTDIPNEIVLVTGRMGDTLTVVRAQEGTAGLAWNVGDTFGNWNTAGTMEAFAQFPDVQQQKGNFGDDTGTANAGVVTLSPAPVSLASITGSPITVQKIASPNTGVYTLNVNDLGATAVQYQGSALVPGDLPASLMFTVRYDGENLELVTPPGNARSGPPSGPASGVLTGTYPGPGMAANAVATANIAANAVTNAKLAQAGAQTTKGNPTGGTANVEDVATPFSMGLPGYDTMLSGRITQWGYATNVPYDGTATITFPIPFPNQCFGVLVSMINPTANIAYNNVGQVVSYNASGCVIMNQFTLGTQENLDMYWEAKGY